MSIFDDPRYHYTERFIREANPRGVSAPTAFERGIVRADPSTFGMFGQRAPEMEILPEEDMRPREDIESEDSIFQVLYDTIIGEQGIPEGVSPEAIAAIRGDFGPTSTPDELREVAQQIANAGGFDQWLASQEETQEEVNDMMDQMETEMTEEPAAEEASEESDESMEGDKMEEPAAEEVSMPAKEEVAPATEK